MIMKAAAALQRAALIEAAADYARALRRQDDLATALDLALTALDLALTRGKEGTREEEERAALDREHSAACDALDAAEHELLVCAAVAGGWAREDAEESV